MDPEVALRLLIAEYSRMAAAYDRDYALYHAPMVQRIIALAALERGQRVLDLGCGTGTLTFEAVRQIGKTGSAVGIDLAEGMLSVATAKNLHLWVENVRFELMDNRKLAFADGAFDAVLSCFGIAILGHERTFREAFRVLSGDGRFVLCHWSGEGSKAPSVVGLLRKFRPKELPDEIRRLLEARQTIDATGEPAALGNPETVIEKLSAIGFREASCFARPERVVYPDPAAYLARGLAMGDNEKEFRMMSPAVREAFLREFEEQAAPFVTEEGLVSTVGVNYFIARK